MYPTSCRQHSRVQTLPYKVVWHFLMAQTALQKYPETKQEWERTSWGISDNHMQARLQSSANTCLQPRLSKLWAVQNRRALWEKRDPQGMHPRCFFFAHSQNVLSTWLYFIWTIDAWLIFICVPCCPSYPWAEAVSAMSPVLPKTR